ncbi:hypothetical protein [Pontibacter ruber]|uniref:Lipoprotein n=1 Tax=Pontibacter ruber TaxID=1343895 RepID=A0ABW5CSS4_9BACT|nr:hypothetical protein [Pontibacter ruber]
MAALSVLCFAMLSCEVDSVTHVDANPEPSSVTYTIPKGAHSATNNPFKLVSASKIRFQAVFDSSAVYTTTDPVNQGDINKLYGLSDCSSDHQTNSARFGWRWYNNRLEVHAYTYYNKSRKSELVSTIEIGKPYTFELRLEDNKFVFELNGKTVSLPRACTGKGEGYQLYPYFGGDEVAPHEIKIEIKELL